MLLHRFACAEPVAMNVVPLLSYPEGLPPCPISAEIDDPVSKNFLSNKINSMWTCGHSMS